MRVPARRPADRAASIPAPARSWRWRTRHHSTLQSGTCPVRWVCLLPRGADGSAIRPPLPESDAALARTFNDLILHPVSPQHCSDGVAAFDFFGELGAGLDQGLNRGRVISRLPMPAIHRAVDGPAKRRRVEVGG